MYFSNISFFEILSAMYANTLSMQGTSIIILPFGFSIRFHSVSRSNASHS